MFLSANEEKLFGSWALVNGVVKQDEICNRIEWLTANHLVKIASDSTGWEILYLDPTDSRYWVLTYPNSEMHGGGPQMLTCITKNEAIEKFNL